MDRKAALKALFSENLDRQDIDENETIFDMGGNSLVIYKICQQAEERYDIRIKPIDLMMYPTVNKITEYLSSSGSQSTGSTESASPKTRRVARRRKRNGR